MKRSNFQVRGPSAEFQEHVQADAAAEEVAGGGGLDDRHLGLHRQDRRAGTEAQEAHLHRGLHQGRPRAALQQGMHGRFQIHLTVTELFTRSFARL